MKDEADLASTPGVEKKLRRSTSVNLEVKRSTSGVVTTLVEDWASTAGVVSTLAEVWASASTAGVVSTLLEV